MGKAKWHKQQRREERARGGEGGGDAGRQDYHTPHGSFYTTPDPDYAELKKLAEDESRFHLITFLGRPRTNLFFTQFEYTYFTPGTGRNALFELQLVKWEDMIWAVASFPRTHTDEAQTVARKLGLRFADGVPTMIDHKGVKHFPLNGKFVFALENDHLDGVAGAPMMATEEQIEQENAEIKRWLVAHGFSPL